MIDGSDTYGLRVIASDTPIHREVGRDYCAYFAPDDSAALAELLTALELGTPLSSVRPASPYAPTSWVESTRALLQTTLEIVAPGNQDRPSLVDPQRVGADVQSRAESFEAGRPIGTAR